MNWPACKYAAAAWRIFGVQEPPPGGGPKALRQAISSSAPLARLEKKTRARDALSSVMASRCSVAHSIVRSGSGGAAPRVSRWPFDLQRGIQRGQAGLKSGRHGARDVDVDDDPREIAKHLGGRLRAGGPGDDPAVAREADEGRGDALAGLADDDSDGPRQRGLGPARGLTHGVAELLEMIEREAGGLGAGVGVDNERAVAQFEPRGLGRQGS